MGNSAAPAYASIFMSKFKEDHILSNKNWEPHFKMFVRFIDNIFLIWRGPKDTLMQMLAQINEVEERVQFTHELHETDSTYLDVKIIKTTTGFEMDIYRKPTDRNNMLLYQSYHQESLKKHLPYTQVLRVKRITSNNETREICIEEMLNKFKERRYPETILTKAKQRSTLKTREELLKTQVKTSQERIKVVSKFSTKSTTFRKIIRKHWPILQQEPDFGDLFLHNPRFAYTRGKNLGELIRAKHHKEHFINYKGTMPC